MKSILAILVFLLFNFSGFAQQIINVFDGFTLEPIDTFYIEISTGKMDMKRLSSSSFVINKCKKKTIIYIKSPNYIGRSIAVSDETNSIDIILKPDNDLLKVYHDQYSYYTIKLPDIDDVDTPAEFPGGKLALDDYLAQNIIYPQKTVDYSIEGKVKLLFTIESDGSINNIMILNSVNHLMDAECIRVVQQMPKWIPGMFEGKYVSTIFLLPISFQL